jgi:glutaminyl-peptide cyclotransferase
VRLLAIALVVQIALGAGLVYVATQGFPVIGGDDGADAASGPAPRATVNRFDGARAWADLKMQVGLGPRPAGSAASRSLAERLRARLPDGRFEEVPGGLRNVVGSLPGRGRPVVIAAHYDTKDLPGFVGANDGAAGTAVVLELVRALKRSRPSGGPPLKFVFFDGEESPDDEGSFLETGLRGSKAYEQAHHGETGALVLLDFVGNRDISLRREASSDKRLWKRLRAAAKRVGVERAFPDKSQGTIYDDHTPFVNEGVPAIDLIDFDYACFHKTCDDLAHVSARSLDAVGEAVLELVRSWR